MPLPIIRPALALAAVFALGGCADYGRYGDGYGYSRVNYGNSAYARSYYGWYNNYYYPGTGYYVYDRRGSRHRWNDGQRRYWEARRDRQARENWSGYRREWRDDRRDRRDDRRERRRPR